MRAQPRGAVRGGRRRLRRQRGAAEVEMQVDQVARDSIGQKRDGSQADDGTDPGGDGIQRFRYIRKREQTVLEPQGSFAALIVRQLVESAAEWVGCGQATPPTGPQVSCAHARVKKDT